eukprot:GFUD01098025.1.p1 GENE.GFUD01098025.1~~GFUD01098025.1.p1  ORF type:complete len:108 (+),score=30.00 GFUD01098025.1:38-325(+)
MFIDWRPYRTNCNFCKVPFKVISKTETFDEDRSRILEKLGVEDEKKVDRMHIHAGSEIQEMTKKFFENITEEVKSELLYLYQYEFAMFNYETDLY